jgi:hypothetical protein
VTDEDPNELRPSLSADDLTEDDRPRRAVCDRQQTCHPPLSDARRRGRSGGPIAQPDMGSDPPRFPRCSCRKVVSEPGAELPRRDATRTTSIGSTSRRRTASTAKERPHVSRQAGKRDARSVPEAGVIPTCPLGTSVGPADPRWSLRGGYGGRGADGGVRREAFSRRTPATPATAEWRCENRAAYR